MADYTEAIRLDPKDAVSFHNRGVNYWAKGDSSRAIADYDEAIRLNPNFALAYCNRGIIKQKINDVSAAQDRMKARQLDASVCN
jgi:tetratricopeptide (TPR) repeat protein